MKIPWIFLHDPNEPMRSQERTYSIKIPKWIISLFRIKGRRILINFQWGPE